MRRVWRRSGVYQGRGGSRLRQEPGSALWVRVQLLVCVQLLEEGR